jgi:hypothetical protein
MNRGTVILYRGKHDPKNPRVRWDSGWGVTSKAKDLRLLTSEKCIHARECSSVAMVAGNEKRFTKIVDDGIVKQWVGIGWVSEGPEEFPRDKDLPRIVRD